MGGLICSATAAFADTTNNWSFDITPYLWVASVDADTSLSHSPSPTSSGVDHFDTRISAGAMIAARAQYRSVGILVDFAWLRLNTEATDPGPAYSDSELKSDFIHSTLALTYSLPLQGKFHADVLAGARLWHVSEKLELESGTSPGFETSEDKTWVDPVFGADLRYDLGKRWQATVKGTVGGFGVSSDLAWEVFAGVSYRITDWCSAIAGYRYLHEEYDRSGFSLNADFQGFLLGVGFHF
jgi:opacity protein-like surface antigen